VLIVWVYVGCLSVGLGLWVYLCRDWADRGLRYDVVIPRLAVGTASVTVQVELVKDPGVVGKFCFLTFVRTHPTVGKARPDPKYLTKFRTSIGSRRLLG